MNNVYGKIKDDISNILSEFEVGLKQAVMFGSRSKGEENSYSDYDILVITNQNLTTKEKMRISKRIREEMADEYIDVDVIIKSENEVKSLKNEAGSIVRNALKDGILI